MNLSERLQARSLLLDELYLRASRAEHELNKALDRVKELEAKLDNQDSDASAEERPA